MYQRYINGMLVTHKKFTSVTFSTDTEEITPLVLEDTFSRTLFIYYDPNDMNTILTNKNIVIKEPMVLSKIGNYTLFPRSIINGINISISQLEELDEPSITGFRQLVCQNIDGHSVSKVDDDLVVLIDYKLVSSLTIENYCSMLNETGYIRAEVYDRSKFIASNISGVDLTAPYNEETYSTYNKPVDVDDKFWLSSPELIANFIKGISKAYPEIQFYTNDDILDLSNYKEHIKYQANLDENQDILNTYMIEDNQFGRIWKSTINLDLDYMTHDLPLLITRRDEYKSQRWLNEYGIFTVPKEISDTKFDLKFGIFWHRNEIPSNYNMKPSLDGNDISKFSFPIRCSLLITLVEKNNVSKTLIETVIKNIIVNKKF
jgi:hypothetical protein